MNLFRRKKEATPEQFLIPGWTDNSAGFGMLANTLSQLGSPLSWEDRLLPRETPIGESVARLLRELNFPKQKGSLTDAFWLLATALRHQSGVLSAKKKELGELREEVEAMQQRCAMMGEVVRTSQNRASELEETGVKLASRALQLKHQLYKQKGSMSPDPARVRAMLVKGDDIDTWDGDIWYDDDDRYPDQPSYPPFPGPGPGEDTAQAQARPAMVTTYTYPIPQGEAEGNDFDTDYAQAEGDARVRPGEAPNAGRRQVQYKDYTMKELSGMGQRFRQKTSEPLAAWLLRIWEEGGGHIYLTPEELVGMGTLATDPRLNQELRGRSVDTDYLFYTITAAAHRVFPSAMDWDHKVADWETGEEGAQVLRQQALAAALYAHRLGQWAHGGGPEDELFTAGMQTRLVRSAAPALRGVVLSITGPLIRSPIARVIGALQTLSEIATPRSRARPVSTDRQKKEGPPGPSRRELFLSLLQAGVRKEEIDGKPTSVLHALYKTKVKGKVEGGPGLKSNDVSKSSPSLYPSLDDVQQLEVGGVALVYHITTEWIKGDPRPYIPVIVHWGKGNDQRHLALVDTGAEHTVIPGNPDKWKGPPYHIEGMGRALTRARGISVRLTIGNHTPVVRRVLVAPTEECILGMNILRGLQLQTTRGAFTFGIRATRVIVGKARWEPVHIPAPLSPVSVPQYRIPGGHDAITETVQALVQEGIVRPATSPFNSPIWPVQKPDGSWRMTVDYRRLNRAAPPLAAAVPDIVTIIENIAAQENGSWYAVIDLANAFFSIPISTESQDQFAFIWKGRQYTFTRLPQGYLHSPTVCHGLIARDLAEFTTIPSIIIHHYIDDIMSVVFLGIQWHAGEQVIPEKVRQKIINIATPSNKTDTQRFLGLLGYWRRHIPHLSGLLRPLYVVTRKKAPFEWGEEQQKSFEDAKLAVQQALPLSPRVPGVPFELQVTADVDAAHWSMWQKQAGRRVPLGFWSRKMPDAATWYTAFERQLLACYWALIETERMTGDAPIVLRPSLPIMNWILSDSANLKQGRAQLSSIVKWKWYIQDRATKGPDGVSRIHELVAEQPLEPKPAAEKTDVLPTSPVKWGRPFEELTDEEKKHAWFTDGSSKWVSGVPRWRAAAYHPSSGTELTEEGMAGSSQLAELVAVTLPLDHSNVESDAMGPSAVDTAVYLYTDSWAVANGLTVWMPDWERNGWTVHGKPIWGQELWKKLWAAALTRTITVWHVDAHDKRPTETATHNEHVDMLAAIRKMDVLALGRWAHEQSGHRGEKGTREWAQRHGIALTGDTVKELVHTCPTCQEVKPRRVMQGPPAAIKRGKAPARVWQVDYIGPMPECRGKKYCLVMVDTYSGVVLARPSARADQDSTVAGLDYLISHYGIPEEIQSDNGSHFTGGQVADWAVAHGVYWVFHIPYYPQASGLVERMNGLLKEQIRLLTPSHTLKGWCIVLQQAVDRLNQRVGKGGTPLERLLPPDGNQAGIDIEEDEEEKMVSVVGQQDFDDALVRPADPPSSRIQYQLSYLVL
ncbi:uncharacterized protein [Hemitrygon akajei]|uniref:uncharacterized protein n=1 Tax=Hemitrygon akajei TaxID=2704970 RepID=UPI003BF98436